MPLLSFSCRSQISNVQAVESTKNHNFQGIYLLYKRFFSFAAAKFTAELKMLPQSTRSKQKLEQICVQNAVTTRLNKYLHHQYEIFLSQIRDISCAKRPRDREG